MKKTSLIASLFLVVVTTSFIYKVSPLNNPKGFIINGSIQGYPDGTWLFLEDESGDTGIMIDSASIMNGRFKFKGTINKNAIHSIIRTKDFSDYKFFWLENNVITFKAEKDKFHYALITGSKTQNDDDKLSTLINPFEKKMDSLNSINKKNFSEPAKAAINKQFNALMADELAVNMDFIKNNPNSLISAATLDIYSSTIGKGKAAALYNSFSQKNKETQYGKNIFKYITLNKNLKIGDHYADFSQKTPEGKDIKISDFTGKVILIDFWASWCVPCRKENPELVKTYANFKDKGFEIVGVSLDRESDRKDWTDAIQKDGLTWPNISELKGDKNTAALMYGISGIPDNFLIDKNGIILARNLRGQELRDKLQELFK